MKLLSVFYLQGYKSSIGNRSKLKLTSFFTSLTGEDDMTVGAITVPDDIALGVTTLEFVTWVTTVEGAELLTAKILGVEEVFWAKMLDTVAVVMLLLFWEVCCGVWLLFRSCWAMLLTDTWFWFDTATFAASCDPAKSWPRPTKLFGVVEFPENVTKNCALF